MNVEERVCQICNTDVIEDEMHLLMLYNALRTALLMYCQMNPDLPCFRGIMKYTPYFQMCPEQQICIHYRI